jgi:Xaa-Pro aminopeptidase
MNRLSARFAELKIDALLVSALPNIRYLTGFTGSNALLLITSGESTLLTDPRYEIQASEQVSCPVRIVRSGPLAPAAAKLIAKKRLKRIGFEKARMVYSDYLVLHESLGLAASLKPMPALVEQLRMVKTEAEIAKIRRSVIANSNALAAVVPNIRAGLTESEVAADLEYEMRQEGAEKAAFETIVATGARTALPHAEPGWALIEANQLLLIDMGACLDGYASDMTRMFVVGKAAGKLRKIYNAVLKAQLAAIDSVRAGVTALHVDGKARGVLEAEGYGKQFVHSTGHGLGLEIHEPPRIGKKDNTVLAAGMVITIEPGAYMEGLGGVRIEDTVLVTDSGCEVLTPTSKELLAL